MTKYLQLGQPLLNSWFVESLGPFVPLYFTMYAEVVPSHTSSMNGNVIMESYSSHETLF